MVLVPTDFSHWMQSLPPATASWKRRTTSGHRKMRRKRKTLSSGVVSLYPNPDPIDVPYICRMRGGVTPASTPFHVKHNHALACPYHASENNLQHFLLTPTTSTKVLGASDLRCHDHAAIQRPRAGPWSEMHRQGRRWQACTIILRK